MTASAITDLVAMGEDFVRDPYPVYAGLRERGPVHRVRIPEGAEAWLVVGYDAGRAVLSDPRLSKRWENAAASFTLPTVAAGPHMLGSDPPDHGRLRRLVAREFTARRVEQLAPRIQQVTDELLDAMLASPTGRADLVEALSLPLPMSVISELLGVPMLDRAGFHGWTTTIISDPDPGTRAAAAGSVIGYLDELLAAKRRQPGQDLMSALIRTADEDGDRLSADELRGTAWLLLVAGYETTVNLISNGFLALATHPDQRAALRAEPALMDNAVEEMLRYDGPVETPTFRFATEPIEIGETVIPRGELVLVALADADRDPARFPDPGRFDIRRAAQGHLAFGHGIHYCLGASLARLETRIAIGTLLRRCPGLVLDARPAELMWRHGMLMRGPRKLPIRFTPEAPVSSGGQL
jgi:cytochrome P450